MSEIASAIGGDSETSSIVKKGEIVTQVVLNRSMKGVTIQVKGHPAIEAFARGLGDGESQDIKLYGRHWHPVGDTALRVYNYDPKVFKLDQLQVDDPGIKIWARYDIPGQPLYDSEGRLNLSFLRLAGISDGPGITFGISGVYTLDRLRLIRDHISAACRRFYVNYMRPVDLSVTISTQELLL